MSERDDIDSILLHFQRITMARLILLSSAWLQKSLLEHDGFVNFNRIESDALFRFTTNKYDIKR